MLDARKYFLPMTWKVLRKDGLLKNMVIRRTAVADQHPRILIRLTLQHWSGFGIPSRMDMKLCCSIENSLDLVLGRTSCYGSLGRCGKLTDGLSQPSTAEFSGQERQLLGRHTIIHGRPSVKFECFIPDSMLWGIFWLFLIWCEEVSGFKEPRRGRSGL